MSNLKFVIKHNIVTCASSFLSKEKGSSHRSLMFHSITKECKNNDIYSLSEEKFSFFLDIINNQKFPVGRFGENTPGYSITFDDGLLDNYSLAAPILIEKKIPFTIFMISDFLDEHHEKYLNKEHLVELSKNPLVTIGAHGKTHNPLAKLSLKEAVKEMQQSKIDLEDVLGKAVDVMSFPHGSYNDDLIREASIIGYKKCGTSIPYKNKAYANNILVNRQCIFSCDGRLSFTQKLAGKWDWITRRHN